MFALTDNDPGRLGQYRLLASLGEGGMGHVYLAAGQGRQLLAVKRVLPHLARYDGFRRRFALEVETASRVESPHTVRLIDADTEAEQPWLASEFIPGPTLIQHIEENGPLPEPLVRRLGADLAAALSAIHGAGLVHRDLKPSNVILTSTGAKLLDFGISRAIDYSTSVALTQTGGVVGSPGYMSPEQARSNPLTERSDVFSLGCLLAVAATGRAPFDGPSIPQVLFKVVYEQADLDALPGALRDTVGRCLAKEPEDRPTVEELTGLLAGPETAPGSVPASVAAFIDRQYAEVNAFASTVPQQPTLVDEGPTHVLSDQGLPPNAGGPVPPRSGGPVPPPRRISKPVLIAGVAVAALLLAVPIGFALSSGEDSPSGENDDPSFSGGSWADGGEGDDSEQSGESEQSGSALSVPTGEELCEIFDADGFVAALGSEWEINEVQEEDDGACRASARSSAGLGSATISMSVSPTPEDSWLLCPFTGCDYAPDAALVPNSESTARPWDMAGIVDNTMPEMIWYQDGTAGVVRASAMGSDVDAGDEAFQAFLLEQGIALYDLASEG
ncbi:serine/threonine-protein kinase [Nocardiopsis ganjiahuensis]|uniref:serine/threonine-protein kinase n=1 Tax=Nocardiopsis ganjiahuensis TaxID=239984 RepID=UPI000346057F|nr:serine/threonine-protein kinase [Nocardiopsis ganjiahuensis]